MKNIVIAAKMTDGFVFTTQDGRPLRMALLDEAGNVVAEGEELSKEAFRAAIEAHQNLWIGQGHLTVIHPKDTKL